MTLVAWTPEALARLDDIEAYIANDSQPAAKDVIARLLARSRQLETAPLSGRAVPEYRRDDLRELLERPYRIIVLWKDERA
jgi:plasmid stabilization system protein ParE